MKNIVYAKKCKNTECSRVLRGWNKSSYCSRCFNNNHRRIKVKLKKSRCKYCKKVFLKYIKPRRGRKTYGKYKHYKRVTCSSLCSKNFNRFQMRAKKYAKKNI